MPDILAGYAAVSDDWIERSETVEPERLYAPVLDLFPSAPTRILDVGAGAGRDAAWLSGQGHGATAVEPVDRLRTAGRQRHAALPIRWIDSRLPDLSALGGTASYGVVLVTGVWQHLSEGERAPSLGRLAELVRSDGLLILSLRHGPGAAGRPVYPIDADHTLVTATAMGFCLVRRAEAGSIQDWNRENGVTWTWLALRRR